MLQVDASKLPLEEVDEDGPQPPEALVDEELLEDELDDEVLEEVVLLDDEVVHWYPHPPRESQPPKQLPELHEHGQFCGWEMVQQLWELQPPEELELDDELLELEELDEAGLLIVPAEGINATLSSLAPSSLLRIRSVCIPAARLLKVTGVRAP